MFSEVQKACELISNIVGEQFVLTDPEQIAKYGADTTPQVNKPDAVVFPANTSEIQQIIAVANELKISISTVSIGKNWGYGAATPVRSGSIVLVLERMNKILKVDQELAYAVIEPGVTYNQLNEYLKKIGDKLWCDTTDGPPGGSVLGNALERGIGETPYGDHFGNLCGLEIVLANGEIMQTGGGQGDELKTWNTYKWGTGPYLDGLFSQSNLGIVTKAGIWLMPKPEYFNSFTFELADENNFSPLIDVLRHLALQGLIQTKLHIINDIVAFSVLDQYPSELLDEEEYLSAQERARLAAKLGVSTWSFTGGLYGNKGCVAANRDVLKRSLDCYGKLTFFDDRKIEIVSSLVRTLKMTDKTPFFHDMANLILRHACGYSVEVLKMLPHMHRILQGNPTEYFVRHAYFRSSARKPDSNVDPVRDQCGLIWFAPIAPFTSTAINEILAICSPLFAEYGFDFYVALLLTNPRSIVVLMSILYSKQNEKQSKKAHELYLRLCSETERAKYQQYRTGTNYSEQILNCSKNFQKTAKAIKNCLDPQNILAPGKSGLG